MLFILFAFLEIEINFIWFLFISLDFFLNKLIFYLFCILFLILTIFYILELGFLF